MGSISESQYSDFRSEVVAGLSYYTPKQRVPVGTAILDPKNGVTEKSIAPAFRPISIRGLTFQNRIWVAPMCMYSCQDGMFSDFHVAHYGQIIDLIHSQSQKVAIQLQHAGRKGSVTPPWLGLRLVPDKFDGYANQVQGPTAEPWNENYATPGEMSEDEILEVIESYGQAARRAVKAGVDVIAVHGAHGYLLHSFASPATNKRKDQWGGSFENRTRIGVEIIRAIRRNIPENMPVFWKISAVDWLPKGEGWELEDTLRYIPILAAEGVDLFDVSSGGTDRRQQVQLGQQYQVPFAKAVKDLKLPNVFVAAVGWIRDADTVHDILSNGKADVVHVAREFLRDPNFVQRVALATGTEVTWVDQYHRAPMNRKYVESTTTITTDAKVSKDTHYTIYHIYDDQFYENNMTWLQSHCPANGTDEICNGNFEALPKAAEMDHQLLHSYSCIHTHPSAPHNLNWDLDLIYSIGEENSNAIQEYCVGHPWKRGATLPIADSGSDLAALSFKDGGKIHLRVYYQAPDLSLREHCYDSGWFEGGFSPGVAIKSSAIAATSWGETVDGVQLRVFWQDNHGLLRGYRWSRGWESSGSLNLIPVATRISATNWDNGSSVRVYYQANDGTISEEVTHSLTTTIIQV
ncbi:hypothetical protein J3E69DRAFT_357603 [Trichoderma sp. SZMC 28015]